MTRAIGIGRASLLLLASGLGVAAAAAQASTYPEGILTPRNLTPEESAWIAKHPIRATPLRATAPPEGPVTPTAEYEPMEAILLAYEGSSSWLSILRQMAVAITTLGDADVWIYADTTNERNSIQSALTAAEADMSRVNILVKTTDTIWIRDYGPQYIREGGVRAAVDHTYNRPRPADNTVPAHYAAARGHLYYDLPLVHGGGNYQLSLEEGGHATTLIQNENPGLTGAQIIGLWQEYWGLVTSLESAFPTSVDSTQHIDMWMQMCSDTSVVISDWPAQSGTIQDQICDAAAADFASRGFTVTRVPARSVNGTHYTYTNVVICNDIVLVPTYTNTTIVAAGYNAQALTAWQSVFPGKTIIAINCQAIVTSAGVMHCITKHIPANLNGPVPTAYMLAPNAGGSYAPGERVTVRWISDDDLAVSGVEVKLSTDAGQTWESLATGLPRNGSYQWSVPDVFATDALLRVVARDAQGNAGRDDSDLPFAITGTPPCVPDLTTTGTSNGTPDGVVNGSDFTYYLSLFASSATAADLTTTGTTNGIPDGVINGSDFTFFLGLFAAGCP